VRRLAVPSALVVPLALSAAALVAACGGGSGGHTTQPQPSTSPVGGDQVVVLSLVPSSNGGFILPDTSQTVKLAPGQTLAVETTTASGASGSWSETSAGTPGIVGPAASETLSPCPTAMLGCGASTARVYRALAAGTTTLVWTYSGVSPTFSAPASQPREPCTETEDVPSGGKPPQCPVGIVRITVTVT